MAAAERAARKNTEQQRLPDFCPLGPDLTKGTSQVLCFFLKPENQPPQESTRAIESTQDKCILWRDAGLLSGD